MRIWRSWRVTWTRYRLRCRHPDRAAYPERSWWATLRQMRKFYRSLMRVGVWHWGQLWGHLSDIDLRLLIIMNGLRTLFGSRRLYVIDL